MRTLVVSHNGLDPVSSKLRGLLRSLVEAGGPAQCMFDNAELVLSQGQAELIVVVLWPHPEPGLEVLRRLRGSTAAHLFAVGQVSDAKLILRALQSGADHYLDQAELENELEAALSRLRSRQDDVAPSGRLIAVLGCCGGVGTSTLAVNVAAVLAGDHHKCALLDLKPGRGDLAALLDLKPAFTLADLSSNVSRLDRVMFEKMLVRHASGVHLLGAPQSFAELRAVTPKGVSQAVSLARKSFPHIVGDLEDCFHEEQIVALRQAAGILLVSRLDFTALRNARRTLEHLQDLNVSRQQVRLVINRHGQPNELPVAEAEDALGEKIAHLVPDDPKALNSANNAGVPVVLKEPAAKVSLSIAQLARIPFERRRDSGVLTAPNGRK